MQRHHDSDIHRSPSQTLAIQNSGNIVNSSFTVSSQPVHDTNSSQCRIGWIILGAIMAAAVIALSLICLPLSMPSTDSNYGNNISVFGRLNETETLRKAVLNDMVRVIQVTGPPGIGKSTVVHSALHNLTSTDDFCVKRIDCLKVENDCSNELSIFESIIENHAGLFFNQYPCVSGGRNFLLYFTSSRKRTLRWWEDNLSMKTILVIDNVNASSLQMSILNEPSPNRKLNIILVSQFKILIPADRSEHSHIMISRLRIDDCISWVITSYYNLFDASSAKVLCKTLDGYPLAVKLTVTYIMQTESVNVSTVLNRLMSPEYNHPFLSYVSMIDHEFDNRNNSLVKALCVIVDSLQQIFQRCALYLSKDDFGFTMDEAIDFLHDFDENLSGNFPFVCINKLIQSSLLHKLSNHYQFLPIIKEFLHWYQPVMLEGRNYAAYKKFRSNYHTHYVKILKTQLEQKNLPVAIRIGSDKHLVNSLLPILNEFPVHDLFEMALNVIMEFCCSPVRLSAAFSCICSDSNYLYAHSRLIKAIHCPMMKADIVLSKSNTDTITDRSVNTSGLEKCRIELLKCHTHDIFHRQMCGRTLTTDIDTIVDAQGYYNMLLMTTMTNAVHWTLSLTDLSAFLLSLYNIKTLQGDVHPNVTAIVYGLKYYALSDVTESEHHIIPVLHYLIDDHGCQTILQLMVLAALSTGGSLHSRQVVRYKLQNIQLSAINMECYLGVMNDIIIPFINEYQNSSNTVTLLRDQLLTIINEENKLCPNGSEYDCHPLGRYKGERARRVLRFHEIGNILSMYPKDITWLCSAVQDKTTRCKGIWPSFSTIYKSDFRETHHLYMSPLRWYMGDKELAYWNNTYLSRIHLDEYPYFE